MTQKRIGFFTRLLDKAPAAERYRLATEQIRHAEVLGFESAWVAQHHFHEQEGGLPAPLVFLAHAGAHTQKSGWEPGSLPCRWKMRYGWRRMLPSRIC